MFWTWTWCMTRFMTCHDDFHDSWYDSWFEWWCFVVASWTLSGTSVLFHALTSIQSWQAELDRVAADNLKATQRSKWRGSDVVTWYDLIVSGHGWSAGDREPRDARYSHAGAFDCLRLPSIAFDCLRASSCAFMCLVLVLCCTAANRWFSQTLRFS